MIIVKQIENRITVTGHAGPPPDLVCEDVTALFQGMLMALRELTADEISYTVEKGYSLLTYQGPLSEQARLLIEAFFVGVCAISNEFPDKVRVSRPE